MVIDTRDADSFAAGHIPGAVNLREVFTFLATSTPEGLKELKATFADALGKAGLSGTETAVFYEDAMNSGYGQSCRGYYLLTWLGYPKIKVLNGGFSAWKAAGLPVSTISGHAPCPPPSPILPMADVMLTQADVQAALGTRHRVAGRARCGRVDRRQLHRPTARTSRRARGACRARSGSSGTAS